MINESVARAFSSHAFTGTYSKFAPDIRWNVVGGDQLQGREQVVRHCEASAQYLANAVTTFHKFRVIAAGDFVVVDSIATYAEPEQQYSHVASCDIYQFDGELLLEITSYNVELHGVLHPKSEGGNP